MKNISEERMTLSILRNTIRDGLYILLPSHFRDQAFIVPVKRTRLIKGMGLVRMTGVPTIMPSPNALFRMKQIGRERKKLPISTITLSMGIYEHTSGRDRVRQKILASTSCTERLSLVPTQCWRSKSLPLSLSKSMLIKLRNIKLLSKLPTGFTMTATTQIAGRGRGSNVWVSPAGSLVFSICMKHAMELSNIAPVVFVQYLAAIAIVEGIHSYDRGYQNVPVKLKWPNDICKLGSQNAYLIGRYSDFNRRPGSIKAREE